MQNAEVFAEYGTEKWVIEENLCFLLQQYHEKAYGSTEMPINPVGFVKAFMQEDTLTNVEFAEKSKMNTVEKNIVYEA